MFNNKYEIIMDYIYNNLITNNTGLILKSYVDLIINKIIPVLFTSLSILKIFDFLDIFNSDLTFLIRLIIIIYIYLNMFISDTILRQSLKIRTINEKEHSCENCSVNVVWNLQDSFSNILFNIIGSIVFKYNWMTDIYWRSYIHSLPIHITNRICVQKTLELKQIGIFFGILNYITDYGSSMIFNGDVCMIINLFITFIFDTIISNLTSSSSSSSSINSNCFYNSFEIYDKDIEEDENNEYYKYFIYGINLPLVCFWKISQFILVGYIEIKKRSQTNKDFIKILLSVANHLRTHKYYKVLFWKEFQSLENFIKLGKVSLFYREHIISFYDLLVNVTNYLNNTTVKIIRKSKIIHFTTIFKSFLPSQYKFYITLFESRKSIEQFVNDLMNDLESAIKNTKGDLEYEEIFSYKTIEKKTPSVIDDYYK